MPVTARDRILNLTLMTWGGNTPDHKQINDLACLHISTFAGRLNYCGTGYGGAAKLSVARSQSQWSARGIRAATQAASDPGPELRRVSALLVRHEVPHRNNRRLTLTGACGDHRTGIRHGRWYTASRRSRGCSRLSPQEDGQLVTRMIIIWKMWNTISKESVG